MAEAGAAGEAKSPASRGKSSLSNMSSAQRAAAVIIALGADKASQIYKYMEPEEVEQLTVEVARMGFLSAE